MIERKSYMSLPVPNLDDKTFEQLLEEARALIPRYAPEWTDHNLHDPGITFMELFAWLAEMQIYSLNRVTEKHRLKFLKLLGKCPQPATPARVPVTFTTSSYHGTITIEKGTQVAATNVATGDDIIFETEEDIRISPIKLEQIIVHDQIGFTINTDANEQDGLFYFALGENPVKGNILYLGFDNLLDDEEINLWINLYEDDLPPKVELTDQNLELLPSARLIWEYWFIENKWKPLEIIDDQTIAMAQNGRIILSEPKNAATTKIYTLEKELYWLRCRILESEYEIPPRIDALLLNTVSATHVQTWGKEAPEILGSSNALPNQVFPLDHVPVIPDSEIIEVKEADETWRPWSFVEDFDASSPEDMHYTVNLTKGEIAFGNGIHGRIPPKGENNIRVISYKTGGGQIGNVNANSINKILNSDLSQVQVSNKIPAIGGREPELLEDAISKAKKNLKTRCRAVTSEDYKTLVQSTPGLRIARTEALPLYNPCYPNYKIPGAVTVVVIPYLLPDSKIQKPMPGKNFCRMVYNHLRKSRLLTTNLFIVAPEYVQVSVKVRVTIKPKGDPSRVKSDIEKGLKQFLNPLCGGPEKEGWPFGRDVMKSEIYQVIDNISDIDCVNNLTLRVDEGCATLVCENIKIPAHALVYSGEHEISIELLV